jgi:hypothetical protein
MKRNLQIYCVVAAAFLVGCNNNNTQKIETAIRYQLAQYPESRLQDIYKNFYQDCFGTGHAISDTVMVLNYLKYEIANTIATPVVVLIDTIGWRHNFVRINIDVVRQGKISTEKLADLFIASATQINAADTANWKNEWQMVTQIIERKNLPVKNYETDKLRIDSILQINPNAAMHHSTAFNENYNPHYRVIRKVVLEDFFNKNTK